ncbi:hypothetical protein [Streptomyces wuyuanensis]|uniref:hypothetical protein n=1 Tax=Streptomyces wuyuanensis TaxID=1196353 RepID=UPI0036AE060A
MDEHVSHRGAYVWSCLPDLPLTWGEMEARCTMCWVQPPFSGAVTQTPWPDESPSWLPSDVGHGMEDGDYARHVTATTTSWPRTSSSFWCTPLRWAGGT